MEAAAVPGQAPARRSLLSRLRRRQAPSTVSFPELVWLHHLRQQELKQGRHKPYEGPAEDRYRNAVERFEAEHGKIVDAYWCNGEASGVALTSVMARLNSGRVKVDWEFGKDTLRTLGALRPFVGGIFGLLTFFALKSGVVALDIADAKRSTYFYVLFAFAAGFSERLAQDMLLGPAAGAAERLRRPRDQQQADEQGTPDEQSTVVDESLGAAPSAGTGGGSHGHADEGTTPA